jgi:hypothetical protein
MIQIKGIKTEKEIEKYNKLSEEGKEYWNNRYPCGKNGLEMESIIYFMSQLNGLMMVLVPLSGC